MFVVGLVLLVPLNMRRGREAALTAPSADAPAGVAARVQL